MGNKKNAGGIQRYSVTSHRTCALRIVPFGTLGLHEHTVRIVNVSVIGAGIESDQLLAAGLVCFEECLGGHKLGVMHWCRPAGERYRAGIRFVTLPYDAEQYILNQVRTGAPRGSLTDPDKTIEKMLALLQQE